MLLSVELGALIFLLIVLLGVIGVGYLVLRGVFAMVRWVAEGLADGIGWVIRSFTDPWQNASPFSSDDSAKMLENKGSLPCPRSNCGHLNPVGSRFCARCGMRLD